MQQTTFKPAASLTSIIDSESVKFLASYYFNHNCSLQSLEIQTWSDSSKHEFPKLTQMEKFLSQLGAKLSELPLPNQ